MYPTELLIVAHGAACLNNDELMAVRQQSIPRFSAALRPQLLKHSDEQTLAAAVALDRAIDQIVPHGPPDFSAWAVVSATRYLGRTAFAAVIDKYKIDGPWGVSVQVIPHTSPHALASTLSLAMASHGPCLGAGSAPGREWQAILTSAALLTRPDVAGAWLVLSGWTCEPPERPAGVEPRCRAAVLALVPPTACLSRTKPIGRVMIEPADDKRGMPEPLDLLLGLTAGHEQGRQIELAGGGLRLHLELFAATKTKVGPPAPHFQIQRDANRPHPNPLPEGEGTILRSLQHHTGTT